MISDRGDGKYAIRFYHEGKPKWILVDADLPQKLNERGPLYAKTSDSDKDGRPEIWAPLIEKAFAKFREKYPVPGKENRKGYHCLHYGHACTGFIVCIVDMHALGSFSASWACLLTACTEIKQLSKPHFDALHLSSRPGCEPARWSDARTPPPKPLGCIGRFLRL